MGYNTNDFHTQYNGYLWSTVPEQDTKGRNNFKDVQGHCKFHTLTNRTSLPVCVYHNVPVKIVSLSTPSHPTRIWLLRGILLNL